MLAVRNSIPSLRRLGIESALEILACELRPSGKKKVLFVVFYRPPSSDISYLKEFTKSLRLASRAKFENIVIVVISIYLTLTGLILLLLQHENPIYSHFIKIINDYFLWQAIDFPTRENNILDLILTSISEKLTNIDGSQDIMVTDHKLVKFCINLRIAKKLKAERRVYNFKKVDWKGYKQTLESVPWDLCFVDDDVNESLSN